MRKKIVLLLIIFFIVSSANQVYAEVHEEKDVNVETNEIIREWLLLISKGDNIDFSFESNRLIDVYLMTSDQYRDSTDTAFSNSKRDFSNNTYEKTGITNYSFSWTVPDDQSYYLIIFNPNNSTATVSFSYSDTFQENIQNMVGDICLGTMCIIVGVIYLVISLIIASWMLRDSDKRGKSGAVWFLVGLILGIVGLIIWLLVRPKEIEQVNPVKDVDRRCPNCGRVIPMDANICPYCGKKFEGEDE